MRKQWQIQLSFVGYNTRNCIWFSDREWRGHTKLNPNTNSDSMDISEWWHVVIGGKDASDRLLCRLTWVYSRHIKNWCCTVQYYTGGQIITCLWHKMAGGRSHAGKYPEQQLLCCMESFGRKTFHYTSTLVAIFSVSPSGVWTTNWKRKYSMYVGTLYMATCSYKYTSCDCSVMSSVIAAWYQTSSLVYHDTLLLQCRESTKGSRLETKPRQQPQTTQYL